MVLRACDWRIPAYLPTYRLLRPGVWLPLIFSVTCDHLTPAPAGIVSIAVKRQCVQKQRPSEPATM